MLKGSVTFGENPLGLLPDDLCECMNVSPSPIGMVFFWMRLLLGYLCGYGVVSDYQILRWALVGLLDHRKNHKITKQLFW